MSFFPPEYLVQYNQYISHPPTECCFCGEPLSTHYYNVPVNIGIRKSSGPFIRDEWLPPTSIARCEKCYQIHKLRDSLSFDHFYWKNPYYWLFLSSMLLCLIPFFLFLLVSRLALLLVFIPIILCYIGAKRIKNWNEEYREKAGLNETLREAEKLHPNCKNFGDFGDLFFFKDIYTVKFLLRNTILGSLPKPYEVHGKHSF